MVTNLNVITTGVSVVLMYLLLPMYVPLPLLGQEVQGGPEVIYEVNHDTSPPLSEIAELPEKRVSSPRPLFHPTRDGGPQPLLLPPLNQQSEEIPVAATPVPATIGLNLDGVGDLNGVVPPDPNASVGATQVVETANLSYRVFKKAGGSQFGPFAISSVWKGFVGNLCGKTAMVDYADPIVLYDKAAKRWLISIIANTAKTFSSNSECIAVSTSSDATSSYNRYEISYGADFIDYPKFGVWPDGYYMSMLVFSVPPPNELFKGPQVCALDRNAMLAGRALSMECFQRASGDFVFLPSDVDGATPPPTGEPNFFLELFPTVNQSSVLLLFKFHADFINSQNAKFTGPVRIPVNPFHEACADGFTCIPQRGTTQELDALGDRLMHRLAYRKLSGHEVLLATHAVVGTSSTAAMRWYEIRSPNTTPVVFQQGVFSPGGNVSAWMGSIAMDKTGDIALGFSTSSSTLNPGIRFTGRVPSDPLGAMRADQTIKLGTGSEIGGGGRWGDYTSMSVDPVDDCTFWYTNEYFATSGNIWRTRLANFKFAGCK